jgi:hypothetical protein
MDLEGGRELPVLADCVKVAEQAIHKSVESEAAERVALACASTDRSFW